MRSLASEGVAPTSSRRPIFAILGQSNATGHADIATGTGVTLTYVNAFPNVRLAQMLSDTLSAGAWSSPLYTELVKPRFAYLNGVLSSGNMGLELSFARTMSRPHNLCKVAIGSTSLAGDWYSDTPGGIFGGASLFLQAVTFLQQAERELNGWIAGIVWDQGEQDATSNPNATAYQTNLAYFIARLRDYWPNVPVVVVRLPSGGSGAFTSTVATAQTNYVSGDVKSALVNTDDVPNDTLHYTADGYVTIGQRCATAMLGLAALADPGTPPLWTKDATSLLGKPNGYWEWGNICLAAGMGGSPAYHHRFQDLTVAHGGPGKARDSIGAWLYAIAGSPTFEAAVSGWSTVGAQFPGATDSFTAPAATGPNHLLVSVLSLYRVKITANPASEKSLFQFTSGGGGANNTLVTMTSDGKLNCYSNSVSAPSVNAHVQAAPFWIAVRYNKTAATLTMLSTFEKLALSYHAITADGTKVIGAASGFQPHPSMTILDHVDFTGVNAEITDAKVKALLQQLGETIPWT